MVTMFSKNSSLDACKPKIIRTAIYEDNLLQNKRLSWMKKLKTPQLNFLKAQSM